MAIQYGTKLGKIINANYEETVVDQVRSLYRLLDQLIQCLVIDVTLSTPPVSPSNGDAYFVAGTGTGAWASHDGEIAVWRTGVTSGTTNTAVTNAWEFYTPEKGWILFSTTQGNFYTVDNSGNALRFNPFTDDSTEAAMQEAGLIATNSIETLASGIISFYNGSNFTQFVQMYYGILAKGVPGGIIQTDGSSPLSLASGAAALQIGRFAADIINLVNVTSFDMQSANLDNCGNVLSTTYTPTSTNVTNITSSTPYLSMVSRNGNEVTVFGVMDFQQTGAGQFQIDLTLPIAPTSNFANVYDAAGCGSSSKSGDSFAIVANVGTKLVSLFGDDNDHTNHSHSFSFRYRV